MTHFVKAYADAGRCLAASRHHRWLSDLGSGVRLPRLIEVRPNHLVFEYLAGSTPDPTDLPLAADALGRLNHAASVALTGTRTDRAVTISTEWAIPDFRGPRATTLNQPRVVDLVTPLVTAESAAIYKDSNLRNMMVTPDGIAIVDFDDLTLAPGGYDLAKLCVSAAMTYGMPATAQIPAIIDSYNATGTPACSVDAVAIWCELTWLLTAKYLGRHGYRHAWPSLRPWPDPFQP